MGLVGTLQVLLACAVFGLVFAAVTHYVELLSAWDHHLPRRRRQAAVSARPIEDVAFDVRRLRHRYRQPAPGTRFVKLEALRQAYDHALSEACAALRVEHLLTVLPAGPELDAERVRVEAALSARGMPLEPAGTSGR
ncbi:hypothetical protein D9V37_01215 [Nocardioides mangrovicus]|uniref:Uncharacterized protein n=1 Tax=Nocardioides mangrovicus TaxID=2478913 RepID=A0A3L8P7I8_9ACTN|nr:hypothetical protein [Nocardioides mangrovicus]RLV50619.1 hypothetical protein D9V37_01215 [Nocardioides mangrovicus]